MSSRVSLLRCSDSESIQPLSLMSNVIPCPLHYIVGYMAGLAVSAILCATGLTPLRPDQVAMISPFDWVHQLTCWHDGSIISILRFGSHSLTSNLPRSKVQDRGPSWEPCNGSPPWFRWQTHVPARSLSCPTVGGCSSLCECCDSMESVCAAAIVTATGGRSCREQTVETVFPGPRSCWPPRRLCPVGFH